MNRLIILSLSFLFLSCSNETDRQSDSMKPVSFSDNQNKSLDIYETLNSSFKMPTRNGEGDYVYPDYYGGSYIDNNGKLIILSTNDATEVSSDLFKRANSSDYTIKKCTYSFNELKEFHKYLDKKFDDDRLTDALKWTGVGIDVEKNRVVIHLEDCSATNINKFKEMVSDSPMIYFEKLGQIHFNDLVVKADTLSPLLRSTSGTNLHLGTAISTLGQKSSTNTTSTRFVGSIGFRAMHGTEHGFVTAAHVTPKSGQIVYRGTSSTQVSKVTSVNYNSSPDAAFIAVTYPTFYVTNVVYSNQATLNDKIISTSSLNGLVVSTKGKKTAVL